MNETPLVNLLYVIVRFVLVAYGQIHALVKEYRADAPQSHQCGFIAQTVREIEELEHAVVGGVVVGV